MFVCWLIPPVVAQWPAVKMGGFHRSVRGPVMMTGAIPCSRPVEMLIMAAGALCLLAREEIRVGLAADPMISWTELTGRVGAHRSTVQREFARNGGRILYRAAAAQARAASCRSRPRVGRLGAGSGLALAVTAELRAGFSPAGVAVRLRAAGAGVLCAETIYRAIYGGLLELNAVQCLRSRRPRRRPRRDVATPAKANILGQITLVHQRCEAAADRSEAGHWEGDLIIGARNASAAITLVERKIRLTAVLALPDGYQSDLVTAALVDFFRTMPATLCRSLTWDQGREMASWRILGLWSGLPVYFCDPHSPWQRPTNENTNRLIRYWHPKGTELDKNSQADYDKTCWIINNQPRRSLGWQTSTEQYSLISEARPDR